MTWKAKAPTECRGHELFVTDEGRILESEHVCTKTCPMLATCTACRYVPDWVRELYADGVYPLD